ncbi:MAG TPA: TetR/AcrR family transcriptional regulator [Gemmatimonadaceae bacterium]|nr:TetR/AcrR family transcriptional regulator [Gemmatimonadaceae bacterium]
MRKGEATRERILESALELASTEGLTGLSIGRLADRNGMSKSGLFAHFGSKEGLQLDVLELATAKFRESVFTPALRADRGEPRLRALFTRWMDWADHQSLPGGCLLTAAAVELDDQPGPARDALVDAQRQWADTLARAVRIAIEERHFRADVDPHLFAFQLHSILLGYHHARRLLRDPDAARRAHDAFEALVAGARPRKAR